MRASAIALLTASAAASACGTFGGTEPDGPSPDGTDSGIVQPPRTDGSADGASLDAGTSDAAMDAPSACTASKAPSCTLASCSTRTLYVPDSPTFPFDIATDSSSVYWLEQQTTDGGDAYNGTSKARVLRVDRVGAGNSARAQVLAIEQQSPTTIAVVPPYVYWSTWDSSIAKSTLRRVKATCTPPCTVETGPTYSERIMKLVGVASTALVAIAYDGTVVRYGIDAGGGIGSALLVTTSSKFPGLAVTGTNIYASGLLVNKIARADLDGINVAPAWASVPFKDGGSLGLTQLAASCTELFGFRTGSAGGEVDRVDLATAMVTQSAPFDRAVYGVAADERYLYAASLNGGGLVAIDSKTTGTAALIANGSFWAVAVDDQGVYWADHPNAGGGTLHMLVK